MSIYVSRAKRNHISTSIESSNSFSDLSTVPLVPTTAAGRYVARNFAVPPALADFLAAAAGLGNAEGRA